MRRSRIVDESHCNHGIRLYLTSVTTGLLRMHRALLASFIVLSVSTELLSAALIAEQHTDQQLETQRRHVLIEYFKCNRVRRRLPIPSNLINEYLPALDLHYDRLFSVPQTLAKAFIVTRLALGMFEVFGQTRPPTLGGRQKGCNQMRFANILCSKMRLRQTPSWF